jgi:serine/threonine protein kinase
MPGLEGKTLGRYELDQLVGKGGMADVYKGYDRHFDRTVAVKVFKREDEDMLRRFIREARLMASFHNEHLVPIYDAGQYQADYETRYYIVMPFMEGGTLRTRIRQSPLSLDEACRALKDIADALDYIHQQGIVHRDIKASNVLLDAQGKYYLSDFGIARISTDATQLTITGNVLGTVDYIAPELFVDNHKADARSDLYSLGVLLFEMVTGQLPFSAENQLAVVSMHMNKQPPSPGSISEAISPQVERVIFKALEKRPEQRYSSATELADAFCRAAAIPSNRAGRKEWGAPAFAIPVADSKQVVLPPVLAPDSRNSSAPRSSPLVSGTEAFSSVPPRFATQPPLETPYSGGRTTRARAGTNRRRWIPVLMALAVLLLVMSVGALFFVTQSNSRSSVLPATANRSQRTPVAGASPTVKPTATPNLTATAQAIAAATATAHAQATATAIAHITATAQAEARATAGVIQTATAGKPSYQDALNDATNADTQAAQWDNNSQCTFQSDGYHDKEGVNLVNFHGCLETGKSYKNATISVDMKINSGHSGGLFFRVNTDLLSRYAGYLFEVDSKGNYKISTMSYTTINALPGHNWTSSASLKQGNAVKNTLLVIVRDNTFLFYANGAFLTQVTDSTYSAEGDIAFLATTSDTPADIVYSNLKVYPQP